MLLIAMSWCSLHAIVAADCRGNGIDIDGLMHDALAANDRCGWSTAVDQTVVHATISRLLAPRDMRGMNLRL